MEILGQGKYKEKIEGEEEEIEMEEWDRYFAKALDGKKIKEETGEEEREAQIKEGHLEKFTEEEIGEVFKSLRKKRQVE